MHAIHVVAVVFNNFHDTLEFCRSIDKAGFAEFCVSCFIVDNSDDDAVKVQIDKLERDFDFVRVLRSSENLGYFGAFNYFFDSKFFDPKAVVLICNNDLVFDRDFFYFLQKSEYNKDVLVVCPNVVTVDGFHQNPHVLHPIGRLSRLRLDLYFSGYVVAYILQKIKKFLGIKKKNRVLPSGYLHMGIGACYILLPDFFVRFNKLIYPHFLYGEEAYLANQVHSANGRLFYDSALKITHKESATLSKLPSKKTYKYAQDGYWEYRKFY